MVHPFAHLRGGYWLPGVTAIPTRDVESGISGRFRFTIGFIVKLLPVCQIRRVEFRRSAVGILNYISNQTFVILPVFARYNDAFFYGWVLQQYVFDLTGLNTKTANLDLLIDSSPEFQRAIRTHADPIPRPVQTRARLIALRVRQKPFRGQGRIVEISAGQAGAADIQLAG